MKPITGSVVSSKTVTSIISRFAASDTAAHQDASAFLRYTSEAFDELARFQKELRAWGQAHGRKDGVEVKRKKEKKEEVPAVIKAVHDENFTGIKSSGKKKEEAVVDTVQGGNFAVTEVKWQTEAAVVEASQDGSFAESGSKRKKKTEKKEEARTESAQDGNFAEIEGDLGTSARGFGGGILDIGESKSGSRKKNRGPKETEGRLGNVVEVETEKSSKTKVKTYEVVNEEIEEDAENQSEQQRKKEEEGTRYERGKWRCGWKPRRAPPQEKEENQRTTLELLFAAVGKLRSHCSTKQTVFSPMGLWTLLEGLVLLEMDLPN